MTATLRLAAGLCVFAAVVSSRDPISIPWNTDEQFGPDGPWQAVQLSIGGSGVSLYPGGSFASYVIGPDFCDGQTDCPAEQAGIYDASTSPTADDSSRLDLGGVCAEWGNDISLNLTSECSLSFDTFKFSPVGENSVEINAQDMLFYTVKSMNTKTPAGFEYPQRVGALALGAPTTDWSVRANGTKNVKANLFAGYLKDNYGIASNSWGIHVGAVQPKVDPTLLIGGYDQSRALGDVAVLGTTGADGQPVATIVDVLISVEQGNSPFAQSNIPSLFHADGNSSFRSIVSPAIPYLSLPYGICNAIAQYIPVEYKPLLGLYTWKTDDPSYESIINSAAQLEFIFQATLTKNLTVKVPFALLNLTLESPLVDTPTPYFPCSPHISHNEIWALGRAFMQAAYLGMNWDSRKFFIAQAPGPDAGDPQIKSFQPDDTTMSTGPISSYASSWGNTWKEVQTPTIGGSGNTVSATATPSSAALSGGAIAGIVIGVLAGLALIALAGFLFWRRRRRAAADTNTMTEAQRRQVEFEDPKHKAPVLAAGRRNELGSGGSIPPAYDKHDLERRQLHEAPGNEWVGEAHELMGMQHYAELGTRLENRRPQ